MEQMDSRSRPAFTPERTGEGVIVDALGLSTIVAPGISRSVTCGWLPDVVDGVSMLKE
jgi:hypothetical protein